MLDGGSDGCSSRRRASGIGVGHGACGKKSTASMVDMGAVRDGQLGG